MRWSERVVLLALITFTPVKLFAHGEQVLVFPVSLALLFILAVIIVAIPWHRLWARGIAAVMLLASNIALWFLPVVPTSIGELAAAELQNVVLALLVIPIVITAIAIALLSRVGRSAA